MRLLYVGIRNSFPQLDDDAFVRQNWDGSDPNQTDRTNVRTPLGCLGGSVACIKGEGLVGAPDSVDTAPHPVGLFLNDVAGNPYENIPAEASNKNTYLSGSGSLVQVDLYETKGTDGSDLVYAAGDKLYCSANGFLTNEEADQVNNFNPTVVGVVLVAPTGSDPFMTVQLMI